MCFVGDHLVGWANASVRHPSELPVKELGVKHRGVFREDPLHCASSQARHPGPNICLACFLQLNKARCGLATTSGLAFGEL